MVGLRGTESTVSSSDDSSSRWGKKRRGTNNYKDNNNNESSKSGSRSSSDRNSKYPPKTSRPSRNSYASSKSGRQYEQGNEVLLQHLTGPRPLRHLFLEWAIHHHGLHQAIQAMSFHFKAEEMEGKGMDKTEIDEVQVLRHCITVGVASVAAAVLGVEMLIEEEEGEEEEGEDKEKGKE